MKDIGRVQKVYKDLKNSVYLTEVLSVEHNSTVTVKDCRKRVNSLKDMEKQSKSNSRLIPFSIGEIILNLKDMTKTKKDFQTIMIQHCGYSVSYAYFLINFYKACIKFPHLKCTSMFTTKTER